MLGPTFFTRASKPSISRSPERKEVGGGAAGTFSCVPDNFEKSNDIWHTLFKTISEW